MSKKIKVWCNYGGAIITKPLEFKGEIDPKFLEKITLPVGALYNLLEDFARSAWEAARDRSMPSQGRYPWRTPDHWFNSSGSHEKIEDLINKAREIKDE